MMSNRKDLIEKLKQTINKRESTSLITEQVEHYIGSDMTNETLEQWVSETIDNTDPVCSDDVLSLWDVGRFNNREILIDMIRNNLGSYSEPSIKRFLSSLCSIEPDITVSGIGVHTTRDFDDIDENDEESTCPYNVKIKTGNFELSLKMLFEFNGGWQLTRKKLQRPRARMWHHFFWSVRYS